MGVVRIPSLALAVEGIKVSLRQPVPKVALALEKSHTEAARGVPCDVAVPETEQQIIVST